MQTNSTYIFTQMDRKFSPLDLLYARLVHTVYGFHILDFLFNFNFFLLLIVYFGIT